MIKSLIKKVVRLCQSTWKPIRSSYVNAVEQAPPSLVRTLKKGLFSLFTLLIIIIVVRWGLVYREAQLRAAEIEAGPKIRVAKVKQSPGNHVLNLIGETRPYAEATLYAKVGGYLKAVKVDKGDKVTEGQILAIIESSETDQAYEAALSDSKNKHNIAVRMTSLRKKDLVSQQEVEQAQADAEGAAARLRAQETFKGYETLRAPFAGTVTARFADPGALVQNATGSQTSALPVVTVSTINRLRVDVFVDQHEAPYVEKNEAIVITQTDQPDLKVTGKVSRISEELDPHTKMLLTEIDLPNENKELVAGSFVQVALAVKSPPYVQAPVESLLMKDYKSFVVVVTPENKINVRPVEVAYNDGKLLWIIRGVKVGETVALNVGETVPEGGKVRPLDEPPAPSPTPSKNPE